MHRPPLFTPINPTHATQPRAACRTGLRLGFLALVASVGMSSATLPLSAYACDVSAQATAHSTTQAATLPADLTEKLMLHRYGQPTPIRISGTSTLTPSLPNAVGLAANPSKG